VTKPSYYFVKGAQDCLNFHVNNLKLLGIAKGDDNLSYNEKQIKIMTMDLANN
jgi:hypothetical protein